MVRRDWRGRAQIALLAIAGGVAILAQACGGGSGARGDADRKAASEPVCAGNAAL